MNKLSVVRIILFFILICSNYSYSQFPAPRNEPVVIKIVQLEHADAEDLAEVLRPFLSKDGSITAYRPANTLIIKDRKSIVRELVKVIKGSLAKED